MEEKKVKEVKELNTVNYFKRLDYLFKVAFALYVVALILLLLQ